MAPKSTTPIDPHLVVFLCSKVCHQLEDTSHFKFDSITAMLEISNAAWHSDMLKACADAPNVDKDFSGVLKEDVEIAMMAYERVFNEMALELKTWKSLFASGPALKKRPSES